MPPSGKENLMSINKLQKNPNSIVLDIDAVSNLKLNDSVYIEYIYHKFLDDPSDTFEKKDISSQINDQQWEYPLCWLARYQLYYMMHKDLIENASILDIGSNFNFFSVCAILNGAAKVHAFEADTVRYELGNEYVKLRNLQNKITTENCSIDDFVKNYDSSKNMM